MRRVMITGAGMVGGALARAALNNGWEPLVLSKEQLDVTDHAAVFDLTLQVKPEVIMHTASLTRVNYCQDHPDEAGAVNVEGTRNVLEAAQRVSAQLIYFSTDYVFAGDTRQVLFESDHAKPVNVYGSTKLAGENLVRGYAKGHVIRTSGVFGKRGDGREERNFFRAVFAQYTRSARDIQVVADQFTAVTYAPHLAQMTFALLASKLPPVVHLCSQGRESWFGWAKTAAECMGWDSGRFSPYSMSELGDQIPRPPYTVLSSQYKEARALMSLAPARVAIKEYMATLGA
jgi:dTDP-4-dehydrorhamnose reductase